MDFFMADLKNNYIIYYFLYFQIFLKINQFKQIHSLLTTKGLLLYNPNTCPKKQLQMENHPSLQHSNKSLPQFRTSPKSSSPLHSHACPPNPTKQPHLPFHNQSSHTFLPLYRHFPSHPSYQSWGSL